MHAFIDGYLAKRADDPRNPTTTVRLGPVAIENVPRPGAFLDLLKSYVGFLRERNGSLAENVRATAVLPEYDPRKPRNLLSMAPRDFGAAEGVAALRAKVRPQEALATK